MSTTPSPAATPRPQQAPVPPAPPTLPPHRHQPPPQPAPVPPPAPAAAQPAYGPPVPPDAPVPPPPPGPAQPAHAHPAPQPAPAPPRPPHHARPALDPARTHDPARQVGHTERRQLEPPPAPTDPSPVDDVDQGPQDGAIAARIRAWYDEADAELRTIPEALVTPLGIREIFDYARKGAWTTAAADSGALRAWATGWAWFAVLVATPLLLIVWTLRSPARFGFVVVTTLLIGTGLGQVPILGWFIPDTINVTAWWA